MRLPQWTSVPDGSPRGVFVLSGARFVLNYIFEVLV